MRDPGRAELGFTGLGKPHSAMFEEANRRCGTMDMVQISDTADSNNRAPTIGVR